MAKKKEMKEQEVEQLENPAEVVMKEKEAEAEAKPEEMQTIPPVADELLKNFSDYDALYIDQFGGVYTKDTQPSLVQDAILYKNPYYNK